MKMKEYVIERDELFKWCSIPVDQLENHPDSKVDLRIFETRQEAMRLAGNMMADEVKRTMPKASPPVGCSPPVRRISLPPS